MARSCNRTNKNGGQTKVSHRFTLILERPYLGDVLLEPLLEGVVLVDPDVPLEPLEPLVPLELLPVPLVLDPELPLEPGVVVLDELPVPEL